MSQAAAAGSPPTAAGRRGPGRAFWLVGGAVAAFGLFLLALAFPPDLHGGGGDSSDAHALSRSPVGYAGIVRLLQATGSAVRIARTPEAAPPSSGEGLLVLTPTEATPASELKARITRSGHVLVIPPKWITIPDRSRPGRLLRFGEASAAQVLRTMTALLGPDVKALTVTRRAAPVLSSAPEEEPLAPIAAGPIDELRTLQGPDLIVAVADARGQVVVAREDETQVYVLVDPDLLNNHGVADLRTARAGVAMLTALADGQPIVWDVTLNGLGEKPPPKSPLKALFVPPFLPATLCLFAAAALTGFAARGRFGAVAQGARAYGFGKRALADSAASLFAMAGREPALAPRYAELARQAAASAAGLPPQASRAEGDAALDRIGAARGVGGWSEVAAAAQGVATLRGLLIAARRAHDWRRGMTGGRG